MASSINAITTGSGGVVTTADNSGDLNIQSGGSTKIAVTSTGAAVTGTLSASGTGQVGTTLGVGNATPSASGAGITFPATQSASTDANTLDDYEEGTFTSSWTGSTTAGTTGYLFSPVGRYTKVGRLVSLYFDVGISSATGTGNVRIGGLPFVAASQTLACGPVVSYGTVFTGSLVCSMDAGVNYLFIQASVSGQASPNGIAMANTNGLELCGMITYYV